MSWERRKRGGWYYCRVRRVNGRLKKEYVGTGPGAELAAQVDALHRHERLAARERQRSRRIRYHRLEDRLQEFCRRADLLARAVLLVRGFYQHHRSEWRRRGYVRDQ